MIMRILKILIYPIKTLFKKMLDFIIGIIAVLILLLWVIFIVIWFII